MCAMAHICLETEVYHDRASQQTSGKSGGVTTIISWTATPRITPT